jgi:hypothetical protein
MRVLVMVKGDPAAEEMPTEAMFAEMNRYNERLATAGVMVDGAGLLPSREGRRIQFAEGGDTAVTQGPFSATSELLAGYWIWQVGSMDEALEWARQAPFPAGQELELRPFAEPEDHGDAYTEEVREQEDHVRSILEANAQG